MAGIGHGMGRPVARWGLTVAVWGAALLTTIHGQTTPDQAAALVLDSARKAYNEKNYPFAVTRFREFLAKYGNHKEVPSARYGLALALLESPERDFNGAIEQLNPLAGMKDFPQHPYVLYYLGHCHRGLGVKELAIAVAKPPEAPQRRNNANQRFAEAVKHFTAAGPAFTAKVKMPPPEDKPLPVELEWAARARCDQAEMELRTLKVKEAQATAVPFVKDPVLARSKYHGLGLYFHGFASFLLKDYNTAGRSLNALTPFADPVFGTHARYLLARVHHVGEELAEAAAHYEGVLAEYDKQKQAVPMLLQQPAKFANDPDEKARLQALVKGPPPDHVARSAFFLGVLLYEGGKFGDALAHFAAFPQKYSGSALLVEAQLRTGFCQVQLKQYAEAIKTLQPLVDKEPRLNDQALFWIGKAQAGSADPNNKPAYEQALRTAIDTLRRAADRAGQLAGNDPEGRQRRGEMLLEMADTQQLAKQYREAANTCQQIVNEKLFAQREEEVVQRQATALHLAGDYPQSDQACQRFQQQFPKSTLLPAVLFRSAENAFFVGQNAEKNPNLPNRQQELARLYDEAIKRFQAVIDKYPEFALIPTARYGQALCHHRKGDYEKARQTVEGIPAADRVGDLAVSAYLLADCLLRLAPKQADDALAAGKLQEQLQQAIELLEGFANAQPNGPQTPDALIKLGLCYQRQAALLAQPPEKAKVYAGARATYERLMQQFPKDPLQPQAAFERAKCIYHMGDKAGATNELRRFTADPLRQAPVAPMAVLQLATWLRDQNNPVEAAKILADIRQLQEPSMLKDPQRAGWVPLLTYHQGVALREANKLPEARTFFNQVMQQAGNKPEANEAGLRLGQCFHQEGLQKVEEARKKLAAPNLKPEEIAAATRLRDEGLNLVRNAVQTLEAHAERLKPATPPVEARARMLYEAAWGCRTLAEPEVLTVRTKMQQEQLEKLKQAASKKATGGKLPAILAAPEIPLAKVPLQPSEQKARTLYQGLIASFPDLPLASDGRLELAELHADRAEYDPAIKLLQEAIDKEPPAELLDKVRIRLGTCLAAKKDMKGALTQFDIVAGNPKSTLIAQAHYRAGESLYDAGNFPDAVKRLVAFRDQQPFQNVLGLTDRALLRLGHAYAQLKQWDQSRQAHETLAGRFPSSPWVHEARYGIGWAWQNLKQYDNAVNAYQQVSAATAAEIGARAQLQIGVCRLDQKRYPEAATALLVVPFTYDYPELSAVALCEAARTFTELKQPEQAEKLLLRVIKDHPDSKWAEVAKERLEALKKG